MLIWFIFAILTALCLAALLIPLVRSSGARKQRAEFDVEIYRDQLKQIDGEIEKGLLDAKEAEAARLEISRRLIALAPERGGKTKKTEQDAEQPGPRFAIAAVSICVPAIALAVYLNVGSPQLPAQPFADRQLASVEEQDLASLILKVEDHLRTHPEDGRGWKIIAPAYLQLRRFRDAASAYSRALSIAGRDAETLTNYGEALVLAEQGLVTEQARAAFLEAAKSDKSQFKAIFYLGLAERQDGKIQSAIALWEKLLADGGKDAPWRPVVEAQLNTARNSLAGVPALDQDQLAAAEDLSNDERDAMVEGMVQRLAERLEENGDDLEGWLRLARSYAVLGRTDDAQAALDKAKTTFADDAASLKQIAELSGSLGLSEKVETAQAPSPKQEEVETTEAPSPTQEDVDAAQSMSPEERREMIKGMVSRLADRLNESGGTVDEWLRLAGSYNVLGQPDDARAALAKAEKSYAGNAAALRQIAEARTGLGLGNEEEVETAQAPSPTQEDVDAAQSMSPEDRREMIEGMVSRLAERLHEDGGSVDEWLRLVRSYTVLGRREDALKALDTAAAKFADDAASLGRLNEAKTQLGLTSE